MHLRYNAEMRKLALLILLSVAYSFSVFASAPAPSVESLAASILRMTSTPTWTPKQYRGVRGEKRVLEHALLVSRESQAAGVDPILVAALITNESSFRADAIGKAGEIGWMQVHPVHTAPGCEGDLREASANLRCGLKELRAAIDACGSVEAALRRYNAGQCDSEAGAGYARRVLRLVERGKGVVVASK